jgi:cell division protein FtsI (penicillin-binding protein 3)
MQPTTTPPSKNNTHTRIRLWYTLLVVVCGVFLVRLFYLQIIKHDYYRKVAYSGQYKEYEIPAERGLIEAHDGDHVVPIVLNEQKFTLFADPKYIKNSKDTAEKVQKIIGGNTNEIEDKMKANTRYAVLAKKLSREQKQKLDNLSIKGVGTREESYRTYPQGTLAAQLLGFVNDEGEGKYGIEQSLQSQLKGKSGQLKAITDAKGVPLVANKDNVVTTPEAGKRVVLTIDISMQQQVEDALKKGMEQAKSTSGCVVVMDLNSGAIKAMANYPAYNPAEFYKVEDPSVFNNIATSSQLEVGSIMKVLTVSAGLNEGVIAANSSYYDSGTVTVDGKTIKNVLPLPSNNVSIKDVLRLSLNTGAVHVLQSLGGGSLNEKGRVTWYDYMTNHYRLGKPTGIEQSSEVSGTIPDPKNGYGLNIQYANTSFGQGMTASMMQMAAAVSSVLNGGTYYKPYLVDSTVDSNGNTKQTQKQVLVQNVVKPSVSSDIQGLMKNVFDSNHAVYGSSLRPNYSIGAKTGTAQIADDKGGYDANQFNGTFMGYVGGDTPQYVIAILVRSPKLSSSEFAGSGAAGPIFGSVANILIDSFGVPPKTH